MSDMPTDDILDERIKDFPPTDPGEPPPEDGE